MSQKTHCHQHSVNIINTLYNCASTRGLWTHVYCMSLHPGSCSTFLMTGSGRKSWSMTGHSRGVYWSGSQMGVWIPQGVLQGSPGGTWDFQKKYLAIFKNSINQK